MIQQLIWESPHGGWVATPKPRVWGLGFWVLGVGAFGVRFFFGRFGEAWEFRVLVPVLMYLVVCL